MIEPSLAPRVASPALAACLLLRSLNAPRVASPALADLHYAKVDLADAADAAAAELYTMTEFKWRTFLKDAMIVGEGKGQLSLISASNIFTMVNQRRENHDKGRAASAATRGVTSATGARNSVVDTVTKAHAQQPGGADASVQQAQLTPSLFESVYTGGSVHGFTLSEFLEGLVLVALELPAP